MTGNTLPQEINCAECETTVLPFVQYKPDIPLLHMLPHLQMSVPSPDTTIPRDRRLGDGKQSLFTQNLESNVPGRRSGRQGKPEAAPTSFLLKLLLHGHGDCLEDHLRDAIRLGQQQIQIAEVRMGIEDMYLSFSRVTPGGFQRLMLSSAD